MFSPYLIQAAVFLIELVFNLYVLAVLLRFLLQTLEADFYNPFSQMLVKVTHPVLRPMRRIIPSVGGIDTSSLVLILALVTVQIYLVTLLVSGYMPQPLGVLITGIGKLLSLTITTYSFMLIVLAIASWFAGQGFNPLLALIGQLVEPLLRPARRLAPPIGGFDLSLLVVLVLLQLLMILLVGPINAIGSRLMVGAPFIQ